MVPGWQVFEPFTNVDKTGSKYISRFHVGNWTIQNDKDRVNVIAIYWTARKWRWIKALQWFGFLIPICNSPQQMQGGWGGHRLPTCTCRWRLTQELLAEHDELHTPGVLEDQTPQEGSGICVDPLPVFLLLGHCWLHLWPAWTWRMCCLCCTFPYY